MGLTNYAAKQAASLTVAPWQVSGGPVLNVTALVWKLVAMAAFYLVLAEIGSLMALRALDEYVNLIWPASGLAVAVIVRGGYKYCLSVFGGYLVWGVWLSGQPIGYAVAQGAAYAVSSGAGAWALRKTLVGDYSLESIRTVLLFLLAGPLLAGLLDATLGATALCGMIQEVPWREFSRLWRPILLGDALGVLVVTPFLLVWSSQTKVNWSNRQFLEVGVWIVALAFFGVVIFGNWAPTDTLRYPLELVLFPIMAWGAIRFGQRGATTGVVLIAIMAIWELLQVFGPEKKYISQSPEFLWVFVGVISVTSYCLAAVLTELRRREENSRMNELRLRGFIDALPDMAFVLSPEGRYLEIFSRENSPLGSRAIGLEGSWLKKVWPPEQARIFQEALDHCLEKKGQISLEYSLEIKGEMYWFEGRLAPITASDGKPDRVIWVAYDITERKRAESLLEQRDQLLRGVSQASSLLLGVRDMQDAVERALQGDRRACAGGSGCYRREQL